MEEKNQKKVLQMISNLDEFQVIKIVVSMGKFESISDYIRSVVTADIVAKKRGHESPWIFGMRQYDWQQLTAEEKERFMSQIGTVAPAGFDYVINKAKGKIYDDVPVIGTNDIGV